MSLIHNAEQFARQAHAFQRYNRKSYADGHLAKVAALVAELGGDDEQIAAAWLHDVVEDANVPIEEIYARFGWNVGGYVGACSGIGASRIERNAVIYSKVRFRPKAALVKVADRIANVEASEALDARARNYLAEEDEFHENVAKFAPLNARVRLKEAYANLKAGKLVAGHE